MTIVDKRAATNAALRFADPLKKRIIYETRKMLENIFITGQETA